MIKAESCSSSRLQPPFPAQETQCEFLVVEEVGMLSWILIVVGSLTVAGLLYGFVLSNIVLLKSRYELGRSRFWATSLHVIDLEDLAYCLIGSSTILLIAVYDLTLGLILQKRLLCS